MSAPTTIILRPRRPVGTLQSRVKEKPKPQRKIVPRKKKRAVLGKRATDGG